MFRSYVSLILLIIFFFPAAAQNTGTVTGYVTDEKTGEALIGVAVQLEGTTTGSVTDVNGYYEIKDITAKTYNVTASYLGYKPETKFNFVVRSGGNPNLNFKLEEQVSEISEVVIIANPFRKQDETPLSIQSLSQEEVATYPGGNNDIAKVVQSLPGISGSVAGFRNDVIIRGGAPNENVYYLDGIEIPNINHFSTQGSAGGPVGLLNVSFFENVTVATSSFASRYDNVLSGVLQFDQRDGNNKDFKTNLRVGASETAITVEGPLFKRDSAFSNTTFIASVRRSYLQLLFKLIDLPFLPDYWDYQYKVTHKINDYNDLIITGVGSIDNFKINVPDSYDPDQQATLDQVPVIKQWTTTAGVSWRSRFKDNSGFTLTTLSTNILNNDFSRYEENATLSGLYFRNNSQEWEKKLRFEYTKFLGAWTVSGGSLVQNSNYTNETLDLTNDFLYDNSLNFWRYGVFGQANIQLAADRLGISGGFRADGNTFTESGNDIYKTFSPRLAISYKLDAQQKWSVSASAGRYFKIPPYTILGFQTNEGVQINRNTEYIQSDHLVAGIEYLLTRSARFSIEGFYKKYENYPVSIRDSVSLANLGAGFEVLGNEPIASVGKGRTYGVEFLFQQKFTKSFYAILAYTLYKSEFTGFNPNEYLPSLWDNRHLVTFTGGYKFKRNWEFGLRTRYLGKSPFAPVDLEASLATYPLLRNDYDQLATQRLNAFNQTDIRIDKKWNFNRWTLDVFVEIQNVLANNAPSAPSIGLDRNAEGEIIEPRRLVEIKELDTSSVLPTLGIIVDF